MRLIHAGIALTFATLVFADTVTLKNGAVINGTYLGGNARAVRIDDGQSVRSLDVGDIVRIEFSNAPDGSSGSAPSRNYPPANRPTLRRSDSSSSSSNSDADPDRPTLRRSDSSSSTSSSSADSDPDRPTFRRGDSATSSSSADSDPDRPTLRRPENVMRPDDTPPPPARNTNPTGMTLSAGTNLVIRMIDSVDSETNHVGQTFRASLDQPVMLNGQTVIPRGNDVVVKLTEAKQSGKLTGKTELALQLQSVSINGNMVDIITQNVDKESSSRGERTAKVAGGGAVLGAIIGGLAGGGKGAAVGAGAGAAAGAGVELATSGQRVKVPSETRITFVLDSPVSF
jgi:hypothetical protein